MNPNRSRPRKLLRQIERLNAQLQADVNAIMAPRAVALWLQMSLAQRSSQLNRILRKLDELIALVYEASEILEDADERLAGLTAMRERLLKVELGGKTAAL